MVEGAIMDAACQLLALDRRRQRRFRDGW